MAYLRRWFQVHLSTAIVMMLTTAALLWANASPEVEFGRGFVSWKYGWPQACFLWVKATETSDWLSMWTFSALVVNALVALGILGVVTTICEASARRSNDDIERRWFQIHHPTAIVLSFIAGVLLWANSHRLPNGVFYGWPCDEAVQRDYYAEPFKDDLFELRWSWNEVFINAVVALGILAAVGVVCEWVLRRRKGGQP